MARDRLIAVGGGLVCALFYLSVKTETPGAIILAYLSQLPLFLVGLSVGLTPSAIACLVAAAAIAVGANITAAGLFAVLSAGPVLILVWQGLQSRPGSQANTTAQANTTPQANTTEWYPPGLLLGWLTGYALVVFGIASLVLLGSDGGIEGAARGYLNAVLGGLAEGAADPRLERILASFARFFPAVVVTAWLMMVVVNAVLAQGALAQFRYNLRPSPGFAELELPGWMTIGIATAALAALVPGQTGVVGQNAVVIMAVPFFFLGLAVIHALSRRLAARGFFLVLLYVVLVLFGWPAILVAGLGIIEQWALLRRRFAAPATGQEDE